MLKSGWTHDRLFRIARQVTNAHVWDRALREDAIGEIYLSGHRTASLHPETTGAQMRHAMRADLINLNRGRAFARCCGRDPETVSLDGPFDRTDAPVSSEPGYEAAEDRAFLERLLAVLRHDDVRALVLRSWGCDREEIMARIGGLDDPRAVETLLLRARQRLRWRAKSLLA